MTDLERLFSDVQKVLDRSRIENEERRKRGELFNIFDVLNLTTAEVQTHSSFLAELLNPQGSHGLGSYPLECFVSILDKYHPLSFISSKASVRKEIRIGTIDKEFNTGGQIDLLIKDGDNAIIIENKINAGDQKKQLLRYYNYGNDKRRYKDFVLLYLTLDGHEPDPISTSDDGRTPRIKSGEDYYCISYMKDISDLLKACMVKAFDKPLVRETLIQYNNLITELTHTSMDNMNKQELLSLMLKNAESVAEIINYRDAFFDKAVKDYFIPQIESIAKQHQFLVPDFTSFFSKKPYCGIDLLKEDWKRFKIKIEFDESNWRSVFLGVVLQGGKKGNVERFSCLEKGNDSWIGGWKYLEPRNLDYNAVPSIINGSYQKQIDTLISSILEEIDSTGREV